MIPSNEEHTKNKHTTEKHPSTHNKTTSQDSEVKLILIKSDKH